MEKYMKAARGAQSDAGDFQYKISEVNIATDWNPPETTPAEMGGFNFSAESKILRWLIRGTVI